MPWISQLSEAFLARFSTEPITWRTVGREAEHPLVRADGSAADASELWPLLQEGGELSPKREGDLLVALEGPDYMFTAEVGRGTMEIVTAPCSDLVALCAVYEDARGRLVEAASQCGVSVLGYGVQPLTPASSSLLTPKRRYRVLLDAIGSGWLWFTLTASDQVHAAIGRAEVVPFTNLANLLAPVTVALCANSSIVNGAHSGHCSAREAAMGAIQASQHRHGMPGSPIQSVEDHIERLVDLPLLMLKREGRNEVGVGRFSEHLNTLDATEQALAFSDFLHHEHYVWHSARPRSAHATLELRAACQQPPREHMAAAALGVAMVQAAPQLAQLVAERLGSDPWAVMRSWHPAVIDEGLAVTEPVPGLLADVLSCCYAALRARGRGEQRFLDPLGARLDARINPAQASHAAFEAGGLHALLDAVRCT